MILICVVGPTSWRGNIMEQGLNILNLSYEEYDKILIQKVSKPP